MQYIYGEKSFAQNLFDAAKAKLQMPATGWPAMPARWTSLVNYGENASVLSRKIQVRSMRGEQLRIDSMPLCTQDPARLGRLPQAVSPPPSQLAGQTDPFDWGGDALGLGADLHFPPVNNSSPAQGPPSGKEAHEAIASARAATSSRAFFRIPTTALSIMLSVAAAVTAGVIVGNTSTIRLDDGGAREKSPPDILADSGAPALNAGSPNRLALEPTLPASYKTYPAAPANGLSASNRAKPESARPARHAKPAATGKFKRTPQYSRSGKTRFQPKAETTHTRSSAASRSAASSKASPATAAGTRHAGSVQSRQLEATPGMQYARCGQLRGLLRRERCKWEVCGGKWGKQGCPAYQHNAMPEFGYGQYGQVGQSAPDAAERPQNGG